MDLLLMFLISGAVVIGILVAFLFGLVIFVALLQRMRWLVAAKTPVDPADELLSDLVHHILEQQRVARVVARERRYS